MAKQPKEDPRLATRRQFGEGALAPRIPARAWEKVTAFDDSGRKANSEFWLNGKHVGRAEWYPSGNPALVVGLRNGRAEGYQIEYHEGGGISFAEPYVRGVVHGLARQYDVSGRLLLVNPFVRGTGTDFFCDQHGNLAEEHPLVGGRPSGRERWWTPDGTVSSETDYLDGVRHGLAREWSGRRLLRGFPKFYLQGKAVARRVYLRARSVDATLPDYRPEDDDPRRELPATFIMLRTRAARMAASPRRTHAPKERAMSAEPIVFDRVIAERRYQAGDEWILLQIGMPRRTSWKTDFYCPIRLVGRETRTLRAFGIDSVQALFLALHLARISLRHWKPPVFWEAGERPGDVGISPMLVTGMGLDFELGLEELIDRAVAKRGKQQERGSRRKTRARAPSSTSSSGRRR